VAAGYGWEFTLDECGGESQMTGATVSYGGVRGSTGGSYVKAVAGTLQRQSQNH